MQQKRYKDKKRPQHKRPNGGGGNGSNNGNNNSNNNNNGQRGERAKAMRGKYLDKARDALASGDRVTAEHYFQYADHYTRQIDGDFSA